MLKGFGHSGFPPGKATEDMDHQTSLLNIATVNKTKELMDQNGTEVVNGVQGFGVHIGESKVHGKGMLTTRRIPAGTLLFIQFLVFSPKSKRIAGVEYSYDEYMDLEDGMQYHVCCDALPKVNEFAANPSPMARKMETVNGALVNHSCGAAVNTVMSIVKEEIFSDGDSESGGGSLAEDNDDNDDEEEEMMSGSDGAAGSGIERPKPLKLNYYVYTTTQVVEAGTELFCNYNKNRSDFWHLFANLVKDGVPLDFIVRCNCKTNKKRNACPRNLAYNSFFVERSPADEAEDAEEAADAEAEAAAAAPAVVVVAAPKPARKPPTVRPAP